MFWNMFDFFGPYFSREANFHDVIFSDPVSYLKVELGVQLSGCTIEESETVS